ncbi:uncharacterized protein LOC143888635 [Tasmannia lanceolata]|uniref:uncharacterized protein LOC143888635 n=1 Tax=Tasmannia lanceolata TaxID=3420 RepID=UPI004062FB3E
MDFVTGLPRTLQKNDAIWVVVDRLTKSAHFLSYGVGVTTLEQMAECYVDEIVKLHGVPVSIVSDRDRKFVSQFWQSLHRALGTRLDFSTAYHPQTDGQSERTIQTLEDILRACAIDFKGNWDKQLPLTEFSYNNSYQVSYKGSDEVCDPGKVDSQICGTIPYDVLEKIGTVASRLALPPSLAGVHNVFHILMLRKYVPDPSHVIPQSPLQLSEDLTYDERPEKIIDRKDQVLRRRTIPYVKVKWSNHSDREATWGGRNAREASTFIRKYAFKLLNFADEIFIRRRE